jgi:hypothetical protein
MDKDNDRKGNKGGEKYGDEEDSDGSEESGERASSAAGASRGTLIYCAVLPHLCHLSCSALLPHPNLSILIMHNSLIKEQQQE